MSFHVYLSGEIHTDWRDEIQRGAEAAGLDVVFTAPVTDHDASIDAWPKEVAPSDALRKAFHAGEIGWGEFRRRYLAELKAYRETLRPLAERAAREPVTLVFAAKDERHNNAVVLAQYLAMLEPR